MAQSVRQRNLFAAEDFTVVYDTFKQANFQAYDYDTIKASMVDYIRANYPENFNDWTESSEFVALIELLAFMGHNLAFRADLASRENFLSTAERRDSVLRIADFLGYTPARTNAASGLLKIDSVNTTQNVYDVAGNSLKNKTVSFVDDQDTNSYQNFILILNEIFTKNTPFGRPSATASVNGIQTEIYKTSLTENQEVAFNFSASVNGSAEAFEIVNSNISENNTLIEPSPEPNAAFNVVYRNDKQGITSDDTGFFVGFKQGKLSYSDYNADTAIANLKLTIPATNVNNSDVWVQSLDSTGNISTKWTKVPRAYGNSALYNAVINNNRTLFSVSSLENDAVSVNFGDSVFSDIPRGIIRIWYRTSLNQTYTLNVDDVGSVGFSIKYDARDGNQYTATFNCSLQRPVSNASARESITSIKSNAGRTFAAQDRMITAEDYNILPIASSQNIRKIKSVNRTHSGHSRFIDINDPTAQYQNVNIVGDDGYIYGDSLIKRDTLSLPTNLTNNQIFDRYISNLPANPEIMNFFYANYDSVSTDFSTTANSYRWNQVSRTSAASTGGYLSRAGNIVRVGDSASYEAQDIKAGSIIEFIESPYVVGSLGNVGDHLRIINSGFGYTSAPTVTVVGTGSGATAVANVTEIPDPANPAQTTYGVTSVVLTNGGSGYTNPVTVLIEGGNGQGAIAVATAKSSKTRWARVINVDNDGLGVDDAAGNATGRNSKGEGAIVLSTPIPNGARITNIFQSYATQFTASEKAQIINQLYNRNNFGIRFDSVTSKWEIITGNDIAPASENKNFSLNNAGNTTSNNMDNSWLIKVSYSGDYWTFLTRRQRVIFGSEEDVRFYNNNGRIKWDAETNKPQRDSITIFKSNTESEVSSQPLGEDLTFYAYDYYTEDDGYTDDHRLIITMSDINNSLYPTNPMALRRLLNADKIDLITATENGYTYKTYDATSITPSQYSGRANLTFKWKRVADTARRIDPSISNIIDVFCLTNTYDNEYKRWLADDRREETKPLYPTSDELSLQFESLASRKSISDTVIYRSAKYKSLFGDTAESNLQATFRIIKVVGTTLSDNEIKNRVVEAIDEFFDVDNWDFGETFYFTELSAYIHNKLLGIISSIVIVPLQESSSFGNLFQVTPDSDELLIPDVTLNSIDIVDNFTGTNLRIK